MYWNEIQLWINFMIVQVYMELTISINLVQLLIVFNKHNEMIILEEEVKIFFNLTCLYL